MKPAKTPSQPFASNLDTSEAKLGELLKGQKGNMPVQKASMHHVSRQISALYRLKPQECHQATPLLHLSLPSY
jgi:hypothetical protein